MGPTLSITTCFPLEIIMTTMIVGYDDNDYDDDDYDNDNDDGDDNALDIALDLHSASQYHNICFPL